MSKILHDRVIENLKEAHAQFMSGSRKGYRDAMKKAWDGIKMIRSLGIDDIASPRILELMSLKGEWVFLSSLPWLNRLDMLIPTYKRAIDEILILPSRVIGPQEPYLPSYDNILVFYGLQDAPGWEKAAELERALELYGVLTGGGGQGVLQLYRSELFFFCGREKEAEEEAETGLALTLLAGQKELEQRFRLLLEGGIERKKSSGRAEKSNAEITVCGVKTAEDGRKTAERGMETAEDGRKTAERGMGMAEGGIKTAERGMETAEGGRKTAESSMGTAEGGIKTAERGMETAESSIETAECGIEAAERGTGNEGKAGSGVYGILG